MAQMRKEQSPTAAMNPRLQRLAARGAVGEDWAQIADFDSKRRYKWVFTGDQIQGIGFHEAAGYEVETKRKDGVRALFASRRIKEGDEIEVNGHVLMSIPQDQYEEIVRFGVNGHSGLDMVRRFEEKMAGGRDPRTTNKRVLKPSERYNTDYFGFSTEGAQAPLE